MRKEYELSQEDLDTLLDASKPVPVMYLSGGQPMFGTPQQNVNRVWKEIGQKYRFFWNTAQPIAGKGQRFITAVAIESETENKEK